MSVTPLFLLCSLGIAMTVQAQDCTTPLRGPHMDLKDDYINLDTFPDGLKVTFQCNSGYRSAGGSPSITCSAGSWSPLGLTCEIKNCGPTEEVSNGQVNYPNGTEFGAEAVLICNPGYRPAGRGKLVCADQGWKGKLPVCEVTTCDPPPVVPNAFFNPSKESYQFSEVIQYHCQNGLISVGSKSLTCSEDGTFKPDPPSCIRVQCGNPDSPDRNTEWSSGARPPYGFKSIVVLKCKSGYNMNGSATVTCEIGSNWSPELPICIVPPTEPTTKPTTTTKTATKPSTTPTPKTPKDDGNNLSRNVGIVLGVLISVAVITFCGCYCCGVPGFIKKRGQRRDNTDKEAAHDGEDITLS